MNALKSALRLLLFAAFTTVLTSCSSEPDQVHLTDEGLSIHTSYFDETIPYRKMDLTQAATVSVTPGSAYRPTEKIIGNDLTRRGIWRLKNGEQALSMVDGPVAVYIPAGPRRVLLISVPEPQSFLDQLTVYAANEHESK